MKIPELRQKLSGLSEKELLYLAVEFYKLIPKAKREMYQLDAMTGAPDPLSKPTKLQGSTDSIADMEGKINEFIQNAKAGYYFRNNKVVSRKARRTWRATIKSWYKALISTNRPDADLLKQAELLSSLYLILQSGRKYTFFSSQEPFEAVNIEQHKFYRSVLDVYELASGKSEVIERGTSLLVTEAVSSYYVTSLIDEFLLLVSIPDLYENTISRIEMLLNGIHGEFLIASKASRMSSRDQYNYHEKVNALVELGFRTYIRLGEHTNAYVFFEKHHIEKDQEIKLFVLIRHLFKENKPELILHAIDSATSKGIKPRNATRDLHDYILQHNSLPESF